ncbi:MAG: aminopeptidase P N-terminal domain-containing protein [Betaproteobacteria bacterium]|nr:aminopeptidase P N-terminal domain-containing protein [Betaproteobacteria bacterium]
MQPHHARRARLAKQLKRGLLLLPTSRETMRNADSNYEFRWDSGFYYLTGFREPEAVLAIQLGPRPKHILFCRDKNLEREIWDGFRFGPAQAADTFRFDAAHSIDELDARIPKLMANAGTVHTLVGTDAAWDQSITRWLKAVRGEVRSGIEAPVEVRDVSRDIGQMRLIKDASEIAIMQRANDISSRAHERAMRAAKPGLHEYEIEAELLHEFVRHGARQPAYGSIVAAGANACVLHYQENRAPLKPGDLMLIDAGCELESYAADITRTFPVDGKFTGPQRDVYDIVLAAQLACIRALKPGTSVGRYRDVAVRVLSQGLIDLKLCKGSLDGVIESGAYRQFYMHGAGHWLGLDVHDAGDYKQGGQWVKLAPGMVVTVEPGLYIRPAAHVPKRFWDIGVRIEDDVLITRGGTRNLTSCVKRADDIEALMRG